MRSHRGTRPAQSRKAFVQSNASSILRKNSSMLTRRGCYTPNNSPLRIVTRPLYILWTIRVGHRGSFINRRFTYRRQMVHPFVHTLNPYVAEAERPSPQGAETRE